LILCASQVASWVNAEGKAGQAAPYLREGVGARALGLGNAQAAAVADATAAYWNPAALVRMDGIGIGSQTSVLGENRSWNFLNYCQTGTRADGGRYAYGLSWVNFSAGGDVERRSSNRPDFEGTFADYENTFMASAASQVNDSFSLGTNVKMLTHNLDNDSGYGLGLDLAAWQTLGTIAWGVTWQDVYSYLDWGGRRTERLPALWRLGAAWENPELGLLITADGSMEYSSTLGAQLPGYHAGAEYKPWEWLAVRIGVEQGRPAGGLGFGFNLGQWGKVRVDYAITGEQLPGAGLTHMFSLILDIQKHRAAPRVADSQETNP
jgi:hypothetical protein